MKKTSFISVVFVVGVLTGIIAYASYVSVTQDTGTIVQEIPLVKDGTENAEDNGVACIQVITPARNPETGDIKEFPTPCDVPEGWEVIQNDIPDLNIETDLM